MDKLNIMTKYLIGLIAVLLLAIFIGYRQYDTLLKEKNRLSMNNTTLMNSNKEYKVRDSLNVYEIGRLQLTKDEFKEYKKESEKLIKDLKMKKSEVVTITNTEIKTVEKIRFILKDSCLNYHSRWADVSGCIGDTLTINTRDSISQVGVVEYKHKFLWWKWKVKGVKQVIINHNPNSKISFSEYIEIKD